MRRLTLLVCTLALCAACSEPPQKELDQAQGAIDAARAAGAAEYAAEEFGAATAALAQAHDAVAQRDYRLALSRALDASERAQQSARLAADGKARARSDAERAIATATTSIQQLHSAIKAASTARAPASVLAAARETAAASESALQKARERFEASRYLDVGKELEGVSARINEQIHAINEAMTAKPGRRRG